jgi:hypothetical protein
LGTRRLRRLSRRRLRCTLLAFVFHGSLTRALHVRRSLLARRANGHRLVVLGEGTWRRRRETLTMRRRRSIRRHAVAGRWWCESVAGNGAWRTWETMRSAGTLELRRRRAWGEAVGRVGRLLLLARRTVELRRLLTGWLLLLLLLLLSRAG